MTEFKFGDVVRPRQTATDTTEIRLMVVGRTPENNKVVVLAPGTNAWSYPSGSVMPADMRWMELVED